MNVSNQPLELLERFQKHKQQRWICYQIVDFTWDKFGKGYCKIELVGNVLAIS